MTLGHLDKTGQKWPKKDPFRRSLFSRNRFFWKKESTATQEEQGSKRGLNIWVFFRTNFRYCKNRKQGFTKKLNIWWKLPLKNSDFSENLITRGSIYDTFLTWHLGQRGRMRSIFLKNVGPKKRRKNVETYFPRKGPKSISLDSGHLDKPFGSLIFD